MKSFTHTRSLLTGSLACGVMSLGLMPAHGGELNFFVVADGDSRWFDYFSDAFAQLDQGRDGDPALDGFFDVADLDDSDGLTPIGGTADVFPFEENFKLGTFTYDGPADGTGTFNVTGFDLNVAKFVADDDAVLNAFSFGPYTTTVTDVTGSVTLIDGTIVSFNNVEADVAFEYTTFNPQNPTGPTIPAVFDGVDALQVDNLDFSLNVFDVFEPSPFSPPFPQEWDLSGSVVPVPEPAALTLVGVGLAVTTLRRRRRTDDEATD
ncbi:MAG: PEP-CTERM sorting domain-containing protein [Planctomycetota bacterium]